MPEIPNGNHGQYFSPALTAPFLGGTVPGGFESQGIGQVGSVPFGQSVIGNAVSGLAGQYGVGNQGQQHLLNQQLAAPQQFAVQQQIAAQQQMAAQRQQQVAAQQQQIAAQQQQCAQILQQLANQATMQGVIGQQTGAALQQLAQCLASQSIACQQVAAVLNQIAQQTALQQTGNVFGLGSQQPWQQGINPQVAWTSTQLPYQPALQSRYGGIGPQTIGGGLYGYGQGLPPAYQGGFGSSMPQQQGFGRLVS